MRPNLLRGKHLPELIHQTVVAAEVWWGFFVWDGEELARKLLIKQPRNILPPTGAGQAAEKGGGTRLPSPVSHGSAPAANFDSVDSDQDVVSLHVASALLFFSPPSKLLSHDSVL